jgi:ribonuclease VapC
MILDSSAIVAVFKGEPEAGDLVALVEGAGQVQMSSATLLETSIVLGRGRQLHLDQWLEAAEVEIVPFDREQADLARSCYLEFGKGSGSRAQLNFGDCFSYALAMTTRQPLLFKGDDFRHTDVTPAVIGR